MYNFVQRADYRGNSNKFFSTIRNFDTSNNVEEERALMSFFSKLIYQISDSKLTMLSTTLLLESYSNLILFTVIPLILFLSPVRILPIPSTIHEILREGETLLAVFRENPRRFWKVWFRDDNEKERKEGRKGMDDRIARARPECQTSGLSGLMRVERRSCLNPNPPNRYVRLSPLVKRLASA